MSDTQDYRLMGGGKKKAFISVGQGPACLMLVWRNHTQGERKWVSGGEEAGGWVLTIWGHYRATSGPRRWRATLHLNSCCYLVISQILHHAISYFYLQQDCNNVSLVSLHLGWKNIIFGGQVVWGWRKKNINQYVKPQVITIHYVMMVILPTVKGYRKVLRVYLLGTTNGCTRFCQQHCHPQK